jgi:hypothetical protein
MQSGVNVSFDTLNSMALYHRLKCTQDKRVLNIITAIVFGIHNNHNLRPTVGLDCRQHIKK